MSEAKPTAGEYWAGRDEDAHMVYFSTGQGDESHTIAVADCGSDEGDYDAEARHAILFAEAGTVLHETGMTPKELQQTIATLQSDLAAMTASRDHWRGAKLGGTALAAERAEVVVALNAELVEQSSGPKTMKCPDCARDWGHSYCGTCKGVGRVSITKLEGTQGT